MKLMQLGLLPLGVLLCGCAFKEPTIIYKEKLTPVRCNAVMPDKPNNDGSFEAHKAKMIYFLKCEDLLKGYLQSHQISSHLWHLHQRSQTLR